MENNRKIVDRRPVKLEEVIKADYIPFLGGRPNRETVISNEDILNLSIALSTAKSFENFLEMV
jgi:hypothetical protein